MADFVQTNGCKVKVRKKQWPVKERTKKGTMLSWLNSLNRLITEMTLFEAEALHDAIRILERLDDKEFE